MEMCFLIVALTLLGHADAGVLQAQSSQTREVLSLDGLWYFTTNANFVENIEEETDLEVNLMPVPSSYNDITTKLSVRNHVGAVWYKRNFYVPKSWQDKNVWIRFGSVCYNASVFINDYIAVTHNIGHLPFAAEISQYLLYGKENSILVEVNNILTNFTIPQGYVDEVVSGRQHLFYTFDFFHYAGIDRPVYLYTTKKQYLDDVDIQTTINNGNGLVSYSLTVANSDKDTQYQVNILDKKGYVVGTSTTKQGTVAIANANLWWPYLMDKNPGYLYTLDVVISTSEGVVDHYKQPFGIRELYYDNTTFTINGRDIYIRGFGRHEDSDIRGKGLDLPLIIRDHNLIKWIGANCYRTSHYPYADEIMDLADKLGIMIIDEVPAVNTEAFTDQLLENHKRSWDELYKRDKNRPSVVIWSIANEARSTLNESEEYYRQLVAHVKSHDRSRPITAPISYDYGAEYIAQFMDILGVIRYEAWYSNMGQVDGIYEIVRKQARGWHELYNKPVLLAEYGADSLEGLSFLPIYMWSEEYQTEVMSQHFRAFDELRNEGWFIGEMIWHFADFNSDESVIRAGGNKKGIFSRNRQPKQAAFLLRKRYWSLAQKLDGASLPEDLQHYIIDVKDEL